MSAVAPGQRCLLSRQDLFPNLLSGEGICPGPTADIHLVPTADIDAVWTAEIYLVSTAEVDSAATKSMLKLPYLKE